MCTNMSVNSSSTDDLSHVLPLSSSNSSFHPLMNACFRLDSSIVIFSALSITYVLLLPIFIPVLYLGYQQWKKQHSISTTSRVYSDLFAYHSVTMQLNEFLGLIFIYCGGYYNLIEMWTVGICMWVVTSLGQTLLHLLTCVEHYLAVVHPITYLRLRKTRGYRIRNISIGFVWLLSFGWLAVMCLTNAEFYFPLYVCILVFFIILVSLCSILILCALKHPGVGDRERVDQSKQRAFLTITAIMGVLLLRFSGNLTCNVIYWLEALSHQYMCMVLFSAFWLDLPSTLVLPLLFLQRAGRLQCCKQNTRAA